MLTVLFMFPEPDAVLPVAPPVATLVNVTPVSAAGKMSAMVAPTTLLGPGLVTTIVYVVGVPGISVAVPSVLVIDRSPSGVSVSVSVALLLPGTGSMIPDGTVTVAVFDSVPVAPGAIVPVTV